MSQQENAPDLAPEQPARRPDPGVQPTKTSSGPQQYGLAAEGVLAITTGGGPAGGIYHPMSGGGGDDAASSNPRVRPRPASVDTGSSQTPSRPLAMQAILNPSNEPRSRQNSREPLGSPASASASPLTRTPATPSPVVRPAPQTEPRPFLESSGISPRIGARRILTPRSPAARSASWSAKLNPHLPGTINVTQSPFLQSPEPRIFPDEPPGRTSIESGPASAPSRFPYGRAPVPGGTLFADPRAGLIGSRPHSQDASPSTPQQPFSPFSQTSPGGAPAFLQHAQPHLPPPLPPQVGPHGVEGFRPPQPPEGRGFPPYHPVEGASQMIPVVVDKDSGSLEATRKRGNNRNASKKHRQRRREREDELMRERQVLVNEKDTFREERDFYRSERDFFRDELFARIPGLQLPPRPSSPRHRNPIPESSQVEQGEPGHQIEEAEVEGRNVRRRTGPGPTISPQVAAPFQSLGAFMPTPHSPYPQHHPPHHPPPPAPWSGPEASAPPSSSGPEGPARPQQLPPQAAAQSLPRLSSFQEHPLPPRTQSPK